LKAVTALIRFFYGYSIKAPGQTSAKEPMPLPITNNAHRRSSRIIRQG